MAILPKNFYKGTTRPIRMAFRGFLIAAVGVLIGFAGWSIKPIAYTAYGITAIGVLIGGAAILWSWFGGE